MKKQKRRNISRRDFIKNSSLGIVGVAMSGELLKGEKVVSESQTQIQKSVVVVVRHSGVIESSGDLKQDIVDQMVAKGITAFTGISNENEAWKRFYSPDDMISLKINTLGLNAIRRSGWVKHYAAVTGSVARALQASGHPEKNIIIWDRSDGELENAGFKLSKNPEKMRVAGILAARRDDKSDFYTKESFKVGDKTVRLTKILTEQCSTLINIPLIKHHRNAGVTGAMKTHFGTIDNPFEFHASGCVNPGIPEINALPEIRDKQKLIVVDGLMGIFDGGPWWDRRFIHPFGRIIVGTDPVAVDSVILGILDERRKEAGKEPLAPNVKFLEISEKLGLGNSKMENIDIKEIILG